MVKSIDWDDPTAIHHIANEMCDKFKQFNSLGFSYTSEQALEYVSKTNNLNPVQAEILSTHVVGLHCPDIK